jgi:hypothetical protein
MGKYKRGDFVKIEVRDEGDQANGCGFLWTTPITEVAFRLPRGHRPHKYGRPKIQALG